MGSESGEDQPVDQPAVGELGELMEKRSAKWSRYPAGVLPAWVAEMDFDPAPPVAEALAAALAAGDLGYPNAGAEARVAELFCEWMARRHGWSPSPSSAVVLADVVQALYLCLTTLSGPGDAVVVQTPVYPPFLAAVAATGRRLVENPLVRGEHRFEVDLDGLDAAAREAKMLLLCNPHNPTGRAFDRFELEAISGIALSRGLTIVSDEIHADLTYPPAIHVPIASLSPDVEAITVTLNSATKAFNIAGLRTAVASFGSRRLRDAFEEVPPGARGGLSSLGMLATIAAWSAGDAWLGSVIRYLDRNRLQLSKALEGSGIDCYAPEATYLAWLDMTRTGLGDDPAETVLRRSSLALGSGPDYGEPGKGYARLNFATSHAVLSEIVERLIGALGPAEGPS